MVNTSIAPRSDVQNPDYVNSMPLYPIQLSSRQCFGCFPTVRVPILPRTC